MSITSPTFINGDPIDDPVRDGPEGVPDPAPPAAPEPPEPAPHADGELDDLEQQIAHREWAVKGDITVLKRNGQIEVRNFDKTYVQKPLSFSAMLAFTGLIGEKIVHAMSGPEGLSLDTIISTGAGMAVDPTGLLSRDDFSGVDSFVRGLAKLAQYAPDVVEDCQCIWLRVPLHERLAVKEIWGRSPEDGGLSSAEGSEMIEVFIAQNYREVEDFFTEQLPRLLKKVTKLRNKAPGGGGSLLSKLSRPTAQATPSP